MSENTLIPFERAICYSGYREGQHPDKGIFPTDEQILEDLQILVQKKFKYIRMYDAGVYSENVCRIIRENKLPLKLMLGPGFINEVNNTGCPWNKTIYTEEQLKERHDRNYARIEKLIEIANKYSDVVNCVSVGNENTPDWGENSVPEDMLVQYAKKLKAETGKLVTFNEGAREWPKLKKLAEVLDVICIHSYPLWYGNSVEEAVEINKSDYKKIKECYPDKQILFSEAGWATSCNSKNGEMKAGQATEENEVKYYEKFWNWTDSEKIVSYVFEAFDEPWKGGSDPLEAEKNWGLYYVNRKPKPAAEKLLAD